MEPTTAVIKTAKNLSRQIKFSHDLEIGASDHGKPSLSATVFKIVFLLMVLTAEN